MKIMKNWKNWLPGALIIVLLSSLIGSTYAKYVTQQTLGGTVTIQASLGTIQLLEHRALKQNDGSYSLIGVDSQGLCDGTAHTHMDGSVDNEGNAYVLLPGLDVPKDPFVRIADKTPIPVYIFVEVVSTLSDSTLSFEVDIYDATDNPDGNWIELTGATPKHGGTVYVYTGKTDAALAVMSDIPDIHILKDNQVTVGQQLNADGKKVTGLGLSFYACMYEVASGDSKYEVGTEEHAKSVYDNNTTP